MGKGGHCQVPCGIFDDPKLVADIREACATVRKAMEKGINGDAETTALTINQRSRWVTVKDAHCMQP